ncbi:unnamed protein product [Peronospora farinosa]|uniref:DUSP domain-containing protein n=2 Tax=Peronospora farinosa TaxID=134698 RepID=A0AAV0SR70_9STRA|nr:unnamed protein product [Peronospora farinosa]CAI5706099.1 unnamed protein product [Peronospora farinosa]
MDDSGLVEVEVEISPGPLGIILNKDTLNLPFLKDFTMLLPSDPLQRGAVELSGRVPVGSHFIAVNDCNFIESDLSFEAVNQMLRETSHLQRTLKFYVPEHLKTEESNKIVSISHRFVSKRDSRSKGEESEGEESDDNVQLHSKQVTQTQMSNSNLLLTEPLSPRRGSSLKEKEDEEFEEEKEEPEEEKEEVKKMMTETVLQEEVPTEQPLQISSKDLQPTSPSPHKLVLKIDKRPPSLPTKLSFGTMAALAETRHFDSDDSSDDENDTDGGMDTDNQGSSRDVRCKPFDDVDAAYVTVVAPPGPLGLNLDGDAMDRAVVLGFAKLRDGSKGPLERNGNIVYGSVLVRINGEDVSRASLNEVRMKLNELVQRPRTLVFRLPDRKQQDCPHVSRNPALRRVPSLPLLEEDFDKRRKLELSLVMHYDKPVLSRRECWFCVDIEWMARWVNFVARGGPEPGPITNEVLLHPNWRKMLAHDTPGRPDTARDGLVLLKDYRVVSPMVWCLLAELHGPGEAPLLARYTMDIHAEALSDREIRLIIEVLLLKATVLVNDLRDKCLVRSSK